MIANGLHSIETTEILTTDRVVELVVGIRDETAALARIADAVGGEVVHLGTTRLEDDECELYFRADGEGLDLNELASLPLVESMRTVSETNDGVSFAVTVTDSPPLTQLAAHGGVVTEATATGDEATLTIEAPPEHDVRSILDVFRDEYEGVELRSRVERESRDRTVAEFAAAVDERLTDRQRDALKTAELNGYFEWPRPVDGSEIADRMGITRQTFHQHLRAAERKLVEAYVDPRSDG
jgi:predicted DNA binding protein